MKENDDSVLLKTYVKEWTKFFAQCPYISKPFKSLESHSAQNNSGKSDVVKVTESVSVKKVFVEIYTS